MKNTKTGKRYGGALFVRMDTDTEAALSEVAKLTERNKSDAIRWCVRQMKQSLTTGKKPVMKSERT